MLWSEDIIKQVQARLEAKGYIIGRNRKKLMIDSIEAALELVQRNKALDELTAESQRLGLYETHPAGLK